MNNLVFTLLFLIRINKQSLILFYITPLILIIPAAGIVVVVVVVGVSHVHRAPIVAVAANKITVYNSINNRL